MRADEPDSFDPVHAGNPQLSPRGSGIANRSDRSRERACSSRHCDAAGCTAAASGVADARSPRTFTRARNASAGSAATTRCAAFRDPFRSASLACHPGTDIR